MRIVITGATGNLGTALLRRLGADGEHELVGLARRVPAGDEGAHGEVTWVAADLTEPDCRVPLEDALRGADAVVHLAWGFQPTHDPDYLASLGVGGTGRVLDAVAACRVPRLVHMSSAGAYSPKQDDQPVDESYPTSGLPSSPYSQHKVLAERLVDFFVEERDDVVVTRMRPGLVGQRSAGSALLRYGVPALVPSRVLRHVPVVPLDRSLRMPVVHADDVADAIVRAITRDVGGPFNLAAGPPVTVADLARALGARHVQVPRWQSVLRSRVRGGCTSSSSTAAGSTSPTRSRCWTAPEPPASSAGSLRTTDLRCWRRSSRAWRGPTMPGRRSSVRAACSTAYAVLSGAPRWGIGIDPRLGPGGPSPVSTARRAPARRPRR